MGTDPAPVTIDLEDFDAVGIASDIVIALRTRAIEATLDAVATVSAPAGYQRLVVTARSSGHVVLSLRYADLGQSRRNNLVQALAERGWQTDQDGEGATRRFPPGSEATDAAFEVLAAVTLAGAPTDARTVTAVDASGTPIDLG